MSSHAANDLRSKIAFETEDLIFREMGVADLEFVAGMLADPQVMESYPRMYSREEAVDWIQRQEGRYARSRHGFWLVIDKATGHPLGQAGLLMVEMDGHEEVGLGYLIDRAQWGRGLGVKIAIAVVDYAFHELGESRIICPVRPENIASQRISIRIGMLPISCTTYGGYDHIIFAIEKPEGP